MELAYETQLWDKVMTHNLNDSTHDLRLVSFEIAFGADFIFFNRTINPSNVDEMDTEL